MKVLIIDEDQFTTAVYESELRQQNFETIVVTSGLEGIKMARRKKPNVIILELVLSKLNGFEVLRSLKRSPTVKQIPIVVASVLGQQVDIDEALKLGAVKYLHKDVYSANQIVTEVVNLMSTLL
jgi:DNA-binding response OmpR family regulator